MTARFSDSLTDGVRDYTALTETNIPLGINTMLARELLRAAPGETIRTCETFHNMDATELALQYDITTLVASTGTVAMANPGVTITTAATLNDTAGYQTLSKSVKSGNLPDIEFGVTLPAITLLELVVGLYDDANEYALITFKPASSANWVLDCYDGTTNGTIDTGIPVVAATEYNVRIAVDENAKCHVFIDGVDCTAGAPKITTTDAQYIYAKITAKAAAAKAATIRYHDLVEAK